MTFRSLRTLLISCSQQKQKYNARILPGGQPPVYAGIAHRLVHEISNLRRRVRFPLPAHVETYSKVFCLKMHSKLGVVGSSPTRSTYLWLAVTFSIGTAVFRIAIYITELHSLGGSSVGRALKINNKRFLNLRLVAHSVERLPSR